MAELSWNAAGGAVGSDDVAGAHGGAVSHRGGDARLADVQRRGFGPETDGATASGGRAGERDLYAVLGAAHDAGRARQAEVGTGVKPSQFGAHERTDPAHLEHGRSSTASAHTESATPRQRKISMVRVMITCALGWSLVVGLRSTSIESPPRSDRSSEAVRPTGPAPTMRTATSKSATGDHLVAEPASRWGH